LWTQNRRRRNELLALLHSPPDFRGSHSIVIVLVGGIAVFPIAHRAISEIAPPTVVVRAIYPGANPKVLAETVATPIEQEVERCGEHALYVEHFHQRRRDGADYYVQARHGPQHRAGARAKSRRHCAAQVPEEVRRLGVTTTKRSTDLTMVTHTSFRRMGRAMNFTSVTTPSCK